MTNEKPLGEFDIIGQLLAPLAKDEPGAAGLTDDAAVLDVPDGQQLVVTKDMMVAGVHFLPDDPPDLIARKLLRVNLSDLAATGAVPWRYALGLGLSDTTDDDWLRAFAKGLAEDQDTFGCILAGGDTVSTPGPATLSLTAMGLVSDGVHMSRNGARAGDLICVTGTIGDAALGLAILQGRLNASSDHLIRRYRLPEPRVGFGQMLCGIASAALDVSDGLVADLGHICAASRLGAVVNAEDIPLSPDARRLIEADSTLLSTVLTGGDDYELLFTIPPSRLTEVLAAGEKEGLAIGVIGETVPETGIRVVGPGGKALQLKNAGYRHR